MFRWTPRGSLRRSAQDLRGKIPDSTSRLRTRNRGFARSDKQPDGFALLQSSTPIRIRTTSYALAGSPRRRSEFRIAQLAPLTYKARTFLRSPDFHDAES